MLILNTFSKAFNCIFIITLIQLVHSSCKVVVGILATDVGFVLLKHDDVQPQCIIQPVNSRVVYFKPTQLGQFSLFILVNLVLSLFCSLLGA